MSEIELLTTLMKGVPDLYVHIGLDEPCGPSNELTRLSSEGGDLWFIDTDALGALRLDDVLDAAVLFLKLDLERYDEKEAVAGYLERVAKKIRNL